MASTSATPAFSLTPNQINRIISLIDNDRLISLLNNDEYPSAPARRPPPVGNKLASRWTEWNGAKELYATYIERLATKIDVDWDLLGGHRAVCSDMMSTIPNECKTRVSQWFSTGGPNSDWNYKAFIEHFNENFEDKTSTQAAGESSSLMRQG